MRKIERFTRKFIAIYFTRLKKKNHLSSLLIKIYILQKKKKKEFYQVVAKIICRLLKKPKSFRNSICVTFILNASHNWFTCFRLNASKALMVEEM